MTAAGAGAARALTHVAPDAAHPLRATVLYTRGKALGGTAVDDELIMDAFRRRGMAAESVDLADLAVTGDGRFLITDRLTGTMRPWTPPDAVLMYHGALSPANTGPLLDSLEGAGAFVINRRNAWETMTDKWRFFQLMDRAGVPTIPTRLVTNADEGHAALREFGPTAVFKKPISTEGDDVYIVSSRAQLDREVLGRLDELDGRVIAQPFVESRIGPNIEPAILRRIGDEAMGMRNDFRIMTVRGDDGTPHVIASFHRIAQSADQKVNNVAKGSRAVRVEFGELHPADQKTVLRAVDAMPDGQVVGWDLIGQPGRRVIMEANSGPGLPTQAEGFDLHSLLKPYADLAWDGAVRTRAAAAARAMG